MRDLYSRWMDYNYSWF